MGHQPDPAAQVGQIQGGDVDAVEPARKLATLARETGQRDEAVAVLEQTLSLRPTEPTLLAVLCEVLVDQRAWGRLQAAAQSWAGGARNEPLPWYFIAQSLFEQGRHREAVEAFANYLSLGAHGVADLAAFAGLCLHAHDYSGAEAALAAAREIDAQHPEVLAKSALLHMYFGRFEEAKSACLACLEREPLHVPVHTLLSRLSRGELSTESLQRMEQVAGTVAAPFDLRIPAAFAVAHAFDAMDVTDSASIAAAFDAAEQAFGIANRRDGNINPSTRPGKGRQVRCHKDRSNVLWPILLARNIDAKPLQQIGHDFFGKRRISQSIATAIQADNQAIADQIIRTHPVKFDQILNANWTREQESWQAGDQNRNEKSPYHR